MPEAAATSEWKRKSASLTAAAIPVLRIMLHLIQACVQFCKFGFGYASGRPGCGFGLQDAAGCEDVHQADVIGEVHQQCIASSMTLGQGS